LINTSKLPSHIEVFEPKKRVSNRIVYQKSVFIRPRVRNHLYEDEKEGDDFIVIIPVPCQLKQEINGRLKSHHNISTETIYNDVIGYVQNQRKRVHHNYETRFYQGVVRSKAGNKERAIAAYTKCINLNRYYQSASGQSAYRNRGDIYFEREDYDKAFDDYNKAVNVVNSQDVHAHYRLGVIYRKREEYQNAINHYKKAIQHKSNHIKAFYECALCQRALGDDEAARKDLKDALNNWERADEQDKRELPREIIQKELDSLPPES